MDCLILPCKTITPSKLLETPSKSKLHSRNSSPKFTSDAYLKRLCKLGRLTEAISALDSCGSTVRHSTLSYLIESCVHSNSLDLCYKIHARVKKWMDQPDPFLDTKLVGMFAKCGSLADAFKVFDEMRERNLYAWSAMIGAFSREKRWGDVVALFYWMMEDGGVVPDDYLLPKILQACGNCRDVETGELIHGMVIKRGVNGDLRVNNSILSVYAKCGWLNSAERFFDGMLASDRVSWNALITGYCQSGNIAEAQRSFELMQEKGLEPDVITWNVLISSYSQLGQCDVAMKLMNDMKISGVRPDVCTWTSMILGFAQNNRRFEALFLFREMLLAGVEPNGITLMSSISACSLQKDIKKGKEVHLVAIKLGYGDDVLVGNSLVDMYSKCGKLDAARQVFDMISEKDVYTWNSMIAGYCQAGYCGVAHDLFKQMQESNVFPNAVTWNVMITGYIQNGDEDQAMDLFHMMETNGGVRRDTASWNALIAGYLHHGQKDKAMRIFRKMQFSGVKPNPITILSILPACANLIALRKLKEIHCCVIRSNLESDVSVANSIIDTYAKCGNIKYSKSIFDAMPSMDIITWNTLATGYVLHGCASEAIELFERMRKLGYNPNRSTFASIISAYGLAKKVDEGTRIFSLMTEEYQILPCLDHYIAMVNLYGRSGKLDEAFNFINSLHIEHSVSIWSAVLTACRRQGNVKLTILAGERLLELEPDNASTRRLVSQLYDLRGESRQSWKIKRPGTRKVLTGPIGCSWIEGKNTVHGFVSGDFSRLDGKCVRSWIASIEMNTKESKHNDKLSIQEEENRETTGIHSEMLALAYAVIKPRQPPQTIRMVKNLRMCDHCHRESVLVVTIEKSIVYLGRLHDFDEILGSDETINNISGKLNRGMEYKAWRIQDSISGHRDILDCLQRDPANYGVRLMTASQHTKWNRIARYSQRWLTYPVLVLDFLSTIARQTVWRRFACADNMPQGRFICSNARARDIYNSVTRYIQRVMTHSTFGLFNNSNVHIEPLEREILLGGLITPIALLFHIRLERMGLVEGPIEVIAVSTIYEMNNWMMDTSVHIATHQQGRAEGMDDEEEEQQQAEIQLEPHMNQDEMQHERSPMRWIYYAETSPTSK
ncbi:Pentatricopeptide repeat superfamily protein, partial [Perilla frutescens var. hirtella]